MEDAQQGVLLEVAPQKCASPLLQQNSKAQVDQVAHLQKYLDLFHSVLMYLAELRLKLR